MSAQDSSTADDLAGAKGKGKQVEAQHAPADDMDMEEDDDDEESGHEDVRFSISIYPIALH